MPKIKSAKKALKQSEKRKVRNLRKKREIKLAEKKLLQAISEKNEENAQKYLSLAFKKVDKASKTFIHKNKANRIKSRLAQKVNKILIK